MSPSLIMTGCKIYQMSIKTDKRFANLIFRGIIAYIPSLFIILDSYLIMQVPLDDLKKTFNLTCENKLFFPYLWNCKKNMYTKLEHLPPIECYIPNSMKKDRHAKFLVKKVILYI